jgi:hypothetical protein
MPMPTALMAMDAQQRLRAGRRAAVPLDVRAEPHRHPVTMISKAPPSVSPASRRAVDRFGHALLERGVHAADRRVVGERRLGVGKRHRATGRQADVADHRHVARNPDAKLAQQLSGEACRRRRATPSRGRSRARARRARRCVRH